MAKRSKTRPGVDVDKEVSPEKVALVKSDLPDPNPSGLKTSEIFPAKKRCAGAVRSGDACRYWAMVESDFCYWCQQAKAPRYPLPVPVDPAQVPSAKREIHKQRCKGMTIFGDPCRFFAVGLSEYCLWCQRAPMQKPVIPCP